MERFGRQRRVREMKILLEVLATILMFVFMLILIAVLMGIAVIKVAINEAMEWIDRIAGPVGKTKEEERNEKKYKGAR